MVAKVDDLRVRRPWTAARRNARLRSHNRFVRVADRHPIISDDVPIIVNHT
jgi:hypothetical protein